MSLWLKPLLVGFLVIWHLWNSLEERLTHHGHEVAAMVAALALGCSST